MQDLSELTPIQIAAIYKAITKRSWEAVTKKIKPGEYTGSITVKIDYEVGRLEATDAPASVGVSTVMEILNRIASARLESDIADDLIERVENAINRRKAKRVPKAGKTEVRATVTPVTVMTEGEVAPVVITPKPKVKKAAKNAARKVV